MPQAAPIIALSLIGVSITRSQPNFASSPSLVLNAPPYTPTSSPSSTTVGSRSISSNIACLIASRKVTWPPPLEAMLAARLSRYGFLRRLPGFLRRALCAVMRNGRFFLWLVFFCVAKMNRRATPSGTSARAKAFHSPDCRHARLWRRHFRNWPLPFRPNLVAIIARAVDAVFCKFRRWKRRILRKVALFFEQRIDFCFDLFLALFVEQFFLEQILFVTRNRIALFPILFHVGWNIFRGIVLGMAHAAKRLG